MIAKIFISLVRISPSFQRSIWKWWYQRLGKRAHDSGWTFMNYGFIPKDKSAATRLENKDKNSSSASGRGISYHYNTSIEISETIAILGISKKSQMCP